MGKQRVKITSVETDVMIQKAAQYGGGQYHGARITYDAGDGEIQTKNFHDFVLNSTPELRPQLAALQQSGLPKEVVLNWGTQTGKNGQVYDALLGILPGTTEIKPGEEHVVKPKNKFGSFPRTDPGMTARIAAIRAATTYFGGVGSTKNPDIAEVIGVAKTFEAYINPPKAQEAAAQTTPGTTVVVEQAPQAESAATYEY